MPGFQTNQFELGERQETFFVFLFSLCGGSKQVSLNWNYAGTTVPESRDRMPESRESSLSLLRPLTSELSQLLLPDVLPDSTSRSRNSGSMLLANEPATDKKI